MQRLGSFTKGRSEFFCSSSLVTPMKAVFVLIAALVLISSSGAESGSRFRFHDATIESGLAAFRHLSGNPHEKRYILEVMSGGIAIFDYDNDGLPDVYLVNGSTLDALRGKTRPDPNAKSRLYHNLGKGKFEDVTARARVDNFGRWGMGASAADFDNDGRTDLFVTNAFSRNVLYRNNGNGTFDDVTQKAKIGGEPGHWSAGSAWADYDSDGYVDLFVAGYVALDLNNLPDPGTNQYCRYRGLPVNCGPRGLKGARDYLYHNNRDGTFTEVSDKAGVDDKPGYYGLGCVWADFDNDGLVDLYVANDSTPNYLYHNKGNGTFKDIGFEAGAAVSEDGREQASMGVDAGDYDGDGYLDIFTTNFSDDYSTLYLNEAGTGFSDVSNRSGLAAPGWTFLKWGTGFVDFDNDGRPDVFVANGHIYPEIEGKGFGQTYRQRSQLFENLGDRRFGEVREEVLAKITKVSRGAAFADLDGDGRVDIVINNLDDQPTVMLNRTVSGNWVELKLVGRASNRDAIGARVTITVAGRDQTAEVRAGHSYLSQSDLKLHFGLGSAKKIDAVAIRWPGGGLQKLTDVTPNQILRIEEQTTQRKKGS